jgi:KAP family P-loop domain
MTTIKNEHINDYLKYYCRLKETPEYAVMVKGEWGSGKSFLVRHFLNNLQDQKWLYISLYGVTDFKQIEEDIFSQLHPILASKSAVLAGRIAKGLLKTAAKIDLDDLSVSVSSNVPDIDVMDAVGKNLQHYVLVFDDLERCTSLKITDVLGYINHFVEHVGLKVIIIASENKIFQDDNGSRILYDEMKEKLIGKTLEVSPDFGSAITYFIGSVYTPAANIFLSSRADVIESVFKQSKFKNLRFVRQVLLQYERIFINIEQRHSSNEMVMELLLKYFLCFGMEVRQGNISSSELNRLQSSIFAEKGEDQSKYKEIRSKYPEKNFLTPILSYEVWTAILDRGELPRAQIADALDASGHFGPPKAPNWRILWNFWDLSASEMGDLLPKVLQEFGNCSPRQLCGFED